MSGAAESSADITSGLPCDFCPAASTCEAECSFFTRYVNAQAPSKRKLNLLKFKQAAAKVPVRSPDNHLGYKRDTSESQQSYDKPIKYDDSKFI